MALRPDSCLVYSILFTIYKRMLILLLEPYLIYKHILLIN